MHDSTGDGWLAHFLHGTSTLLQIQRPEALTLPNAQSTKRQSFFLATRIFEISRSLIFSSPTFLSSLEWTTALANFWHTNGAALWHPKEALFDLLPLIADLSIRVAQFCKNVSQLPPQEYDLQVLAFGSKGLHMQESLQQWWTTASAWEDELETQITSPHGARTPDKELLIGHIYYHSISIYLSGTFDYHAHWDSTPAPILPQTTIEWHVREILDVCYKLLDQGVAGVLLFFPLRIAGARAVDSDTRAAILSLLQTTSNRGYVVADAFTADLSQLWWSCERSDSECGAFDVICR